MLDSWFDVAHGGRCVCCQVPGRPLCGACARSLPRSGRPVRPDPAPPGLAPAYAAGWYADPLRPLLLAHKERGVLSLARPLGAVLAGVVASALEGVLEQGSDVPVALVPVPSRPAVVRSRGHDPLRRVVGAAVGDLRRRGYAAVPARLLRQRGPVADQAGLAAGERAVNLAGSLVVDGRGHRRLARLARPVLVVLCDDVLTTGATANEAQRALAGAGVAIAAVAVVAATRKRRTEGPGPAESC